MATVKQLAVNTGRALGLAGVLALGLAAPAQAIVYVGSFDPAYTAGSLFGFEGTATFDIPDACVTSSAMVFVANDSCGSSSMTVLSAELTIYELATPSNRVTHSMAPLERPPEDQPHVYGVLVSDGEVVGAATNYFGGVDFLLTNAATVSSSGFTFDETLWMRFFDDTGTVGDPVDLCTSGQDVVPATADGVVCTGFQSDPARHVVFTRLSTTVPEPGSAALVALAAAGAGLAGLLGRRRQRPR